ncbi:TonB-dependent receptor [Chitinophaga sp. MM2321]|uniref:TonB-dependent receptor n=1 Tax=Chitinophaga sp. MM2321 TaxID=3137178 RepID=UPI0032D58C9E
MGNFCVKLLRQMLMIQCCLFISQVLMAQVEKIPVVTIQGDKIPVSKVFTAIEQQTGLTVFYSHNLLKDDAPVSLDMHQASVSEVLNHVLKGTGITYTISKEVILLKKRGNTTSQERTARPPGEITGSVTDEKANPLPGVSIAVKGTRKGAATDTDGRFRVSANTGDTLVFSFMGYVSREIPVAKDVVFDIILKQDAANLGEVVVVAFGTQKKATITGAISSIQTKEIKQSPAANLAVTLAGRLPGLTAIQTSGEPGRDAVNLFLRGQGTINGQNPLILVDGVERELTYIDPNEVDNVTILKDASSTAMFGVRGANGVILITTRRGRSEKPEISFSAETGQQGFTRTPSQVSAYDFATLRNQAGVNDGLGPNFFYSDAALEHYKLQDDPVHYPNNNWSKLLLNDYVTQNRYNLNLSGGGNFVRYFVNAGYLQQGGQWKVSEKKDYDPSAFLKRYNFRSNIDATLNKAKTLTAFLNVAGYLEKVNSPATSVSGVNANYTDRSVLLAAIWNTSPLQAGPLTPDGQILTGGGQIYPAYAEINRTGYLQETRSNIMASFGMQQDLKVITPGLSVKFMMSFDSRTVYSLLANRDYQRWEQVTQGDTIAYRRFNEKENTNLVTSTASRFESYTNSQLFINYNRTFGTKHTFTGLLLAQQDQRIRPNDRLPYNLRGVAGRATYAYDNKYFAEINAGYNGSEQFAKGHRYGFFPSFSAGWLISDELFLQGNKVLSLLKLRGSYGLVGNDRLGGRRFLYLDNVQIGGGGYSGNVGKGQTVNENSLGNPDLRWEISKKTNVGMELGLFNQFVLTVDVYRESRNDMMINRQTVPMVNGFPGALPPVNLGRMKNHGYEIELNYNKTINKDLFVLAKLNFNHAINKVEFMDEARRTDDYAYPYRQTGYAYGQFFGMITDGYWGSQEEITKSELTFVGTQPRPGDLKFKDANGDKIVDERDQAPIGFTSVPQYTFGSAFNVSYKNFDVSVLFQGVSRVSNLFANVGVYENSGTLTSYRSRMFNAWTEERAAAGLPIDFPALSTSISYSESTVNSFFVENTTYVRLKNVELGYTLPVRWSNKIGSQRIRFYANGLNLYTWTKMRNGDFDPEVSSPLSYPIIKTFNFGVNVVF